jgi:ACS family sodium-dependent inorganic phosphate cotransporter
MQLQARHVQVILVASSRMLCYLARAQLSALLPVLQRELHLSSEDEGYLMSSYFSGYVLTQIIGGVFADRLGGYPVLLFAMIASGLCCLAAPALALLGTFAFGRSFFVMGLVQGAAFPAGNVVCSKWLLPADRPLASNLSAIGAAIGSFLIQSSAPVIAANFGWQAVFFASGGLCFTFAAIWMCLGSSSPVQCSYVSDEELMTLRDAGLLQATVVAKNSPRSWSLLASFPPCSFFFHASVGTLFLCHFAQNWQQSFYQWLQKFYTERLGVATEVAALYIGPLSLVELLARSATLGLPALLHFWGFSHLQCRKLMSLQGFSLHLVLCLVITALLCSSLGASTLAFTVLFALLMATQAFHAGGYYSNYLDVTQRYSGILTGVGNTVATVAGVTFPGFASWGLSGAGGSWSILIVSLIFMDALAILAIPFGMSAKCLDGDMMDIRLPRLRAALAPASASCSESRHEQPSGESQC